MTKTASLIGPDRRYERWRWQIFAITWLAYTGFYLTRKSFAVAKIEMGSPGGLGLSNDSLAWIDFVYLSTYAIGQFAWGICGDRWGTRRVIVGGMLVSVIAAVAMGASSQLILLEAFFGLQGFCQSTGWAPLSKNIGNFFSQRERGTVMGLWCTNYAVGGFIASIVAGRFGQAFGWRWAFFGPATILFGIWILFLLFQRNRPEDVGLSSIETYHHEPEPVLVEGDVPAEEKEGSWKVILEVLRSPMVLLLAAVYFFMKPTRYAIMNWAPKYMHEQLGTNMADSGALGSLFELAGPISIFIAGVVSDRFLNTRRNPISVVCLTTTAILLCVMDKLPHTATLLGGCLFLVGLMLFAPDALVSGTSAVDFGTKKAAATAAGFINGCGSIGAIVGGTFPGFLHKRLGWDGVFVGLAVSLFISAALLAFKWNALPVSKPTGPSEPKAGGAGR